MSRQYDVTQEEVAAAWKAVRSAGGTHGYDNQSIEDIEADLDNQLYKIWNRMSSGSYQAQPVLLVGIPKAKGGVRTLGIPTVTDRIAQGVIKKRLEEAVQPHFHVDSYAYQANKGPLDAVAVARERCFKMEWVVEVDIKGFFDELDHDLMMEIVGRYTEDKTILLYTKKFLKAKGVTQDGEEVIREKGTPQGGVVSPVLANLFLHVGFDEWMKESHANMPFERYADDIIVHCVSEKQAYYIKNRIEERLKQYKLEMHPEKTRVVYTGTRNDMDHRGHGLSRKFNFLGYEFKPRGYRGRTVFSPGIGKDALKKISGDMQKWQLKSRAMQSIEEIAQSINPVIRGWMNYYGRFNRAQLYKLARLIDYKLAGWLRRKYKGIRKLEEGLMEISKMKTQDKHLFEHWHRIWSPKGTSTRAV